MLLWPLHRALIDILVNRFRLFSTKKKRSHLLCRPVSEIREVHAGAVSTNAVFPHRTPPHSPDAQCPFPRELSSARIQSWPTSDSDLCGTIGVRNAAFDAVLTIWCRERSSTHLLFFSLWLSHPSRLLPISVNPSCSAAKQALSIIFFNASWMWSTDAAVFFFGRFLHFSLYLVGVIRNLSIAILAWP